MKRIGEQKEKIYVTSSMERLVQYGISPLNLIGALQQENVVAPAGAFDATSTRAPIQTTGLYRSEDQIRRQMAGMSPMGNPIYIGDLANENYCVVTPVSPNGDPNAPCSTAKVTPGAVQFYFPAGNNCVDQNGIGVTHVFSGEQYNWIVIYQASSLPGRR